MSCPSLEKWVHIPQDSCDKTLRFGEVSSLAWGLELDSIPSGTWT